MALQDLTPQLRTRLSHMERVVGWFVLLATAVLVFGFAYYIVVMAKRKGWFITKIEYYTSIDSVTGLKVGDPVKLMGYDVGEITRFVPNDPWDFYNITVYFHVKAPFYGYLLSDSQAKVVAADFLGHRYLEVTKGTAGVPTIDETTNHVAIGMLNRDHVTKLQGAMSKTNANLEEVLAQLNQMAKANKAWFYKRLTKDSTYWLDPAESPALTERLERVVAAVEKGLPGFLELTNSLARVLTNAGRLVTHADELFVDLRPTASNLTAITDNLRPPDGPLNRQLTGTLASATATLDSARTNLDSLSSDLAVSLMNLADITSNLNVQVQANSNMLSGISAAVIHSDELVQGLKRHWLLRSAFKTPKTNQPPPKPVRPPKAGTQR